MNFITYHYKLFQKIYPKEIWIYTLLILLHMSRKTIFNVQQDVGNESVGGGTLLMLLCTILNYYYAFKESKSLTPAIQATKSYFVFYIFALLSFLWAIFPDYKALFSKCLELISSFCNHVENKKQEKSHAISIVSMYIIGNNRIFCKSTGI